MDMRERNLVTPEADESPMNRARVRAKCHGLNCCFPKNQVKINSSVGNETEKWRS
jgi:hypothetical protein